MSGNSRLIFIVPTSALSMHSVIFLFPQSTPSTVLNHSDYYSVLIYNVYIRHAHINPVISLIFCNFSFFFFEWIIHFGNFVEGEHDDVVAVGSVVAKVRIF